MTSVGTTTTDRSITAKTPYTPKIWLRMSEESCRSSSAGQPQYYLTTQSPINMGLCERLRRLQRDAKHMQYLMACLSTLGGSNHLCNKPRAALVLARQQEHLGHRMGATELVIRARVFQAVNWATLGHVQFAFAVLQQCEELALRERRPDSLHFTRNMRWWLQKEFEISEIQERAEAAAGEVERNPMKMLLCYQYDPHKRTCT